MVVRCHFSLYQGRRLNTWGNIFSRANDCSVETGLTGPRGEPGGKKGFHLYNLSGCTVMVPWDQTEANVVDLANDSVNIWSVCLGRGHLGLDL